MPDCQDVIRELADRHDVFIATAAMDVPCSFDAKYQWLQTHFPVHPAVAHSSSAATRAIIDADYLIDDRARHFAKFKGRPCCSRRRTMPERPVTRELHPGKRCANISPGSIHVLRIAAPPPTWRT